MEYIYEINYCESKRHRVAYQWHYSLTPDYAREALNFDKASIYAKYIKVDKTSNEYLAAVETSNDYVYESDDDEEYARYGYIYKVSFYESNRHSVSNADMYFLKPEHTRWAFDRCAIVKIFYIRVDINSSQYRSAVSNSKLHDDNPDKY